MPDSPCASAARQRDDGTCWECARPRCFGWLSHEWGRLCNSWQSRRHYRRWAWLRATVDRHLLRYNLEHCESCGRRVGLSWWSVTGWTHVVGDGCIRCIRCFNREAWAVGDPVCWIAVSFEEFDERLGRYFTEHHEGRVR